MTTFIANVTTIDPCTIVFAEVKAIYDRIATLGSSAAAQAEAAELNDRLDHLEEAISFLKPTTEAGAMVCLEIAERFADLRDGQDNDGYLAGRFGRAHDRCRRAAEGLIQA